MTAEHAKQLAAASAESPPRGYIGGPWFDCILIIFSPLIAFTAGFAMSGEWWNKSDATGQTPLSVFYGTMLIGHLLLSFVRSHLNRGIFNQFPLRFTIVPALIFGGMILSNWFLLAIGVVTRLWDEWHSCQQTFGFGRLYDMRAGNDPMVGRRMDIALNFLLWSGPVLAGAVFIDFAKDVGNDFSGLSESLMHAIPTTAETHHRAILIAIVSLGIPFLAGYLWFYVRLARKGYHVSWQKVALLVSTGLCSIYAWGFNPFGKAYFIMNIFHFFQYFGIVWLVEKKNIMKCLHLANVNGGKWIALTVYLSFAVGMGYAVDQLGNIQTETYIAAFLLLSLLHFWYDGFIWSVRKKMV